MAEWESSMHEWGLLESCYAVALGMEDCELFAAIADPSYQDPWAALYAEDYVYDVPQEDGTTKQVQINEWSYIVDMFKPNAGTPPLYLAGQKYLFCNRSEESDMTIVLAKRLKGGVIAVKTSNGYYVLGLYDEERDQSHSNATVAILRFAESLSQSE